jgi:hypothetical protein
MKELYQQAVADSERVTKINPAEEIQHATNARSIKERFERGEPIAVMSDDDQETAAPKPWGEKPDEEILAAGKCPSSLASPSAPRADRLYLNSGLDRLGAQGLSLAAFDLRQRLFAASVNA